MFVLSASPASAEDKISLFSFSLDYLIALILAFHVHSTWIKTAAFYLMKAANVLDIPHLMQCLGSQSEVLLDSNQLQPE